MLDPIKGRPRGRFGREKYRRPWLPRWHDTKRLQTRLSASALSPASISRNPDKS